MRAGFIRLSISSNATSEKLNLVLISYELAQGKGLDKHHISPGTGMGLTLTQLVQQKSNDAPKNAVDALWFDSIEVVAASGSN